jgi:hypothetical protein
MAISVSVVRAIRRIPHQNRGCHRWLSNAPCDAKWDYPGVGTNVFAPPNQSLKHGRLPQRSSGLGKI